MPHILVLLRRAAKFSVILAVLGIAEYVIIAHIHTRLGEHQNRMEASITAQRRAQGPYDRELDPAAFRVVGYSWRVREVERLKQAEEETKKLDKKVKVKAPETGLDRKGSPPPTDITTTGKPTTSNQTAFKQSSLSKDKPTQKKVFDEKTPPSPRAKAQQQTTLDPNAITSHKRRPNSEPSIGTDTHVEPLTTHVQNSKNAQIQLPLASTNKETFPKQVHADREPPDTSHKGQETESDEDYLSRLLMSYILESKRRTAAGALHQGPDHQGRESQYAVDFGEFEIIQTDGGLKVVDKRLALSPEILVENDTRPYRALSPLEEKGSNIMFTLRTTVSYHWDRLPLLMSTWMTQVDCSHIFLVTDGPDPEMEKKAKAMGMITVV